MKKLMRWSSKNFLMILVICATLGLAPFVPQPHAWHKLSWVISGAEGMKWFDWFDLLLHGSPWLLLLLGIIGKTALPANSKKSS